MRAPIFGLSTSPVMDIKSEVRLQIERDLLALVYARGRPGYLLDHGSALGQ